MLFMQAQSLRGCKKLILSIFGASTHAVLDFSAIQALFAFCQRAVGWNTQTGRTGKIYKVLCKNTNEMRAIKIIEKGSLFEFIRTRKLIINKIISLKKINHPKIIKILEVYEDQTSIYLIIEYC